MTDDAEPAIVIPSTEGERYFEEAPFDEAAAAHAVERLRDAVPLTPEQQNSLVRITTEELPLDAATLVEIMQAVGIATAEDDFEWHGKNCIYAINHLIASHFQLRATNAELLSLLRDVAESGISFEDERIKYLEVQIDRETWQAIRAVLDSGHGGVGQRPMR